VQDPHVAYQIFFYYVVGCAVALCLQVARWMFFTTIEWLMKVNIHRANLKKLEPAVPPVVPIEGAEPFRLLEVFERTGMIDLGPKASSEDDTFGFKLVLSWIGAVLVSVVFLLEALELVRRLISRTPDAVVNLRYPLRNNPLLLREAVWAHSFALAIPFGDCVQDPLFILFLLNEVRRNHSEFDRRLALEILGDLRVARESVVSRALDSLGPTPTNTP
jgi:hypothetical protein